jgi:hypothetical protein
MRGQAFSGLLFPIGGPRPLLLVARAAKRFKTRKEKIPRKHASTGPRVPQGTHMYNDTNRRLLVELNQRHYRHRLPEFLEQSPNVGIVTLGTSCRRVFSGKFVEYVPWVPAML